MNLILFEDPRIRPHLLPFTFTRPVAAIRVGILTIGEKWERFMKQPVHYKTEAYMQNKYLIPQSFDNLVINGAVCPNPDLVGAIEQLNSGYYLVKDDLLIAARNPTGEISPGYAIQFAGEVRLIDRTWKIFRENRAELISDFKLITEGRKSFGIRDKHTVVYGEENLFVEEGVDVRAAIINAENGPVYLGKNSIVQEGAIIRGAFALGEGSHVNMGAKIRGDVSVGPYSKVGGEISTSVIFGYSNKAHDGFLGCSVLGEWCNLGADTNTSNLKNNYDNVKLYSHVTGSFEDTGLQFCGLMMGDHSKCAINTMFNTGTVVDVSSNVFGEGFPRNYIPSFTWGGSGGMTTYNLRKAYETATRVMARRNMVMDETESRIFQSVFELTSLARTWEKRSTS